MVRVAESPAQTAVTVGAAGAPGGGVDVGAGEDIGAEVGGIDVGAAVGAKVGAGVVPHKRILKVEVGEWPLLTEEPL